LFPIHRLSLAFYHPSIDGLVPRIHVDVDEVLAVIVEDDSSFDDAGDGIPRSGAVPKSTAGSLKLFTVVLMHGKGGEESEEQADVMKRTSYAIGQKRGPSYARSELHICPKTRCPRAPYGGGGPSCKQEVRGGAARKFGAGHR
jgi:hypothetical protein